MTRQTLPVVPLLVLLCLAVVWHLSVGARTVAFADVWRALVAPDSATFEHTVVRDMRLPRALASALVGAGLSVAGALVQGVTRNPLAEPATLGLMAGASSAVVVGIGWFGLASSAAIPAVAAAGAVVAAAVVLTVAAMAPGGARPLTLVLAGAAVTAFLAAIDGIIVLLDQETFRNLRGWRAGTFAGADYDALAVAAPWLLAGLAVAMLLARPVNALALGEETATGLGLPVVRLRLAVFLTVIVLTAASVTVAGIVGFVGLVIPHVARLFAGSDYRAVLPLSALTGAVYLTMIDTVSRIILAPTEVATGLATALIGAPVFLWLVRTRT